ncbi:MAG: hypothetical protein KAI64_03405, partial [Thermoplasmata archaeon]|nr:hypothetical protein [Thermoplasmata archaeon]
SEVISQVDGRLKGRVGRLAFIYEGLKLSRRYRPALFRIESDAFCGEEEAIAVVVCNSARYGGYFRLAPDIAIDDSFLDVCVFKTRSAGALLRSFSRICLGIPVSETNLLTFKTRNISIMSDESTVRVHHDSDLVGSLPLKIGIREGALEVLVP